jgi:hypothetical protein
LEYLDGMSSVRGFRNPAFWLALVGGLLAFCVQSGETSSADTMHRLQTAHSFWTSQPPVFPNEYPEFGVHGRRGKLYDWYGIGQPLLMLPFDIVGTGISKLSVFADYGPDTDPTVRTVFVTYAVNILISALTAVVSYRFLLLLGFDVVQSVAGVLALLFCTSHLHYTQNMMENNYILLLTMAGLRYQYQWLRTGSMRALWIGSAAFGLNLLTRLTTGLDLLMGGIFLLLVLVLEHPPRAQMWSRFVEYGKVAVPVYAGFFLFDRLYQFYRFGEWTSTYVKYFTIEHRLEDPSLPANYPWTTPFLKGFLGPLISPEKSIFLFDPLIILSIILVVLGWMLLCPSVKAFMASAFLLIPAYICFYARYYEWSGNFAWGDRYVSSAVEMAAFLSVPLLVKFREPLGRPIWGLGLFLVGASLVIQFASLAFWLPLEIYQGDDLGHPQWVIWLRFKNIVAFALGKMDAWGLNTDSMTYDHWDFQHITCWNFLPFVLRRIGAAPRWVVDFAFAVWIMGIATLGGVLFRLARMLENQQPDA